MQVCPKTAMAAGIEPLPGSVRLRFVQCGKAGCRCRQGALHGPYLERVWRESGRTRKRHVRQADETWTLRAVVAWQRAYPSRRSLLREVRSLARLLREAGG